MDWREFVLAAALRSVDLLASRLPQRRLPASPPLPAARPGLSILIPERGTPELLDACLASVEIAARGVGEPVEVHVVVNGCARAQYRILTARYPSARWHFELRPLGFNGAILRGLRAVAHDWVYLLNSDMTLASDTLAALLPLRDRRTFAIGSQIFLADSSRRREETGWTDYRIDRGVTEHYDRIPDGPAIRGHLYAGGGASLFRTALLRKYAASTAAYAPFYFEDADWGLQAARAGYAVKFCPPSTVRHVHRATIGRYYEAAEIARVFRRNQLLFEARHGLGGRARLLAGESRATRRELTAAATLIGILAQRWQTFRARGGGYAPELSCRTLFPQPLRTAQRFQLLTPPSGANGPAGTPEGIPAQANERSDRANLVLIMVENHRRGALPEAALASFAAVHFVAAGAARSARQLAWWQRVYGDPEDNPASGGATRFLAGWWLGNRQLPPMSPGDS